MAGLFTVETGAGLAASNSYLSVAAFRSHHEDRERDVDSLTDECVQGLLVRATDYIEHRFGDRFLGCRAGKDQALGWPRHSAFDADGFLLEGVPANVERACAEYALRAHQYSELAPDPVRAAPSQNLSDAASLTQGSVGASGVVVSEKKGVGPLTKEQTFSSPSASAGRSTRRTQSSDVSDAFIPEYPAADQMMSRVLRRSGCARAVRA